MSPDPRHFDRDAQRYDAARPGYPPEVLAALREWGALRPGARVLELGPGTGQATRAPLEEDVREVVAVELGPALAGILRDRIEDDRLTVVLGDAQAVELADGAFDLVVAATSFHWFDRARLLPRLARTLRIGGHLAVWWTVFGDPAVSTPFRAGLDALLGHRRDAPWQLDAEERVADLTEGGLFFEPRHRSWTWPIELSTDEVVALFSTFSDLTGRDDLEPRLRELVDRLGGRIEERYLTAVYDVQKAATGVAAGSAP